MIRFTCTASNDVQMLRAHAEMLLSAIGKTLGERGVITAQEIPAAIAALDTAGHQDRHARQVEDAESGPADEDELKSNQIGLSQRAFPLLEMLKRANAAGEPVVWGL